MVKIFSCQALVMSATLLSLSFGSHALLAAPASSAPAPVKVVEQSTSSPEIARILKNAMLTDARFTMRRALNIQGLTLTSRGEVHQKRDGNWLWEQKQPFPQKLELTNEEILMSVAGDPVQVVRLDSNPVLYAFASTLKALLRLDVATLDKTFRVEKFVKGDANTPWQLFLTPQEGVFQKILKSVTLTGRAKLERVQFTDADRGVTDITFTPM